MSVAEAAYVAGIIDGEGSVYIDLRRGVVAPKLSISNTYLPMLEWFVRTTGIGHINKHAPEGKTTKATFFLRCNGEGAETILRQVRQFMIIKKEQAAIAIAAQERLRDPAIKSDRSWHPMWHQRMKALNRRGPAAVSTKEVQL
jgi:hypothetical protein